MKDQQRCFWQNFYAYLNKSVSIFVKLVFEVVKLRKFFQKYFSRVKLQQIWSKFVKIVKVSPLKVITWKPFLFFCFEMAAVHSSKWKLSTTSLTDKNKALKEIKRVQNWIAISKNVVPPKTQFYTVWKIKAKYSRRSRKTTFPKTEK